MIASTNNITHVLNCLKQWLDTFRSDKITVIYYLILKLFSCVLEDNKIPSLS